MDRRKDKQMDKMVMDGWVDERLIDGYTGRWIDG